MGIRAGPWESTRRIGDMVTNSCNRADTNVGASIRARRKELGISRTNLGKAAGISRKALKSYERGTTKIGPSALLDLAELLKVPLPYFFTNAQLRPGSCVHFASSEDLAPLPQEDPASSEAAALLAALNRIQISPYRRRTLRLLSLIENLLTEVARNAD